MAISNEKKIKQVQRLYDSALDKHFWYLQTGRLKEGRQAKKRLQEYSAKLLELGVTVPPMPAPPPFDEARAAREMRESISDNWEDEPGWKINYEDEQERQNAPENY